MASGRVRTGIRPGTDRYLSGPGSGRFSNMVRSGRVGPASVKYPRNLGRPPEPVRTDRVFISMSMSVQGSRFVDSSIVLPSSTDCNRDIGAQSDQSSLNCPVATYLSSMSMDLVRFV